MQNSEQIINNGNANLSNNYVFTISTECFKIPGAELDLPKQFRFTPDEHYSTFPGPRTPFHHFGSTSGSPPSTSIHLPNIFFPKYNLALCSAKHLPDRRGTREFHMAWAAMKQPDTPGHGSMPAFSGPPKIVDAPSSAGYSLENSTPLFPNLPGVALCFFFCF